MPEQTRQCPECEKLMLLVDAGVVLTSDPPQYPQEWRCGCGHREAGPTLRGKTAEEIFMERWREANAMATAIRKLSEGVAEEEHEAD